MEKYEKCPFCNSDSQFSDIGGYESYQCGKCGSFKITEEAKNIIVTELAKPKINREVVSANIRGWLFEHTVKKDINITQELATYLLLLKSPSVNEKSEKLMIWLEKQQKYAGDKIPVANTYDVEQEFISASWSLNKLECKFLLEEYLFKEKKFINLTQREPQRGYGLECSITPSGYSYLAELNKMNHDSQLGFCAMWFDSALNQVWINAIEPAIQGAKYQAKRIDKHDHIEGVVDEILALIRRSRFIIADLTGNRGGVYYEAGFAKGLGIPVIFTCEKKQFNDSKVKVHFDVQHFNILLWDYDNYGEFKIKLQNRIGATIGQGKFVSQPIRVLEKIG